MNDYWVRMRNNFIELFPDAKNYFGKALLGGCLFGVVVVASFGAYEADFVGINENVLGIVLPFIILASMIAFIAWRDFVLFFQGETNAATIRLLLRSLVFALGLLIGVIGAIILFVLLGVSVLD